MEKIEATHRDGVTSVPLLVVEEKGVCVEWMNVDVAQVEFYPQSEAVSGDEADDAD